MFRDREVVVPNSRLQINYCGNSSEGEEGEKGALGEASKGRKYLS
jgi:hypothetical protein